MKIQISRFETVGSTNDEVITLARAGAPEGICVVAHSQSAGRGREGRVWHSDRGSGLFLSILLRPSIDIREFPLLTLNCAVAVYDSISHLCDIHPDIKWPNDILINGRKICGILAETCETSEGTAVVMGIGLNLTTENLPRGLKENATSISDETGKAADFDLVMRSVLENVAFQYENAGGDAGRMLREWSARSSYSSGKSVDVRTRHETFRGKTEGLDKFGSLLVRRDDGHLVAVTAADVVAARRETGSPAFADKDVKSA